MISWQSVPWWLCLTARSLKAVASQGTGSKAAWMSPFSVLGVDDIWRLVYICLQSNGGRCNLLIGVVLADSTGMFTQLVYLRLIMAMCVSGTVYLLGSRQRSIFADLLYLMEVVGIPPAL